MYFIIEDKNIVNQYEELLNKKQMYEDYFSNEMQSILQEENKCEKLEQYIENDKKKRKIYQKYDTKGIENEIEIFNKLYVEPLFKDKIGYIPIQYDKILYKKVYGHRFIGIWGQVFKDNPTKIIIVTYFGTYTSREFYNFMYEDNNNIPIRIFDEEIKYYNLEDAIKIFEQ